MTDPWTVAISAVATLSGVALGQLWQARRDDKRWLRERERDRESRYREDRNRFLDAKRSTYAEFLSITDRWRARIETFIGYISEVLEEVPAELTEWAIENDFEGVVSLAEPTMELIQKVYLIAPNEIGELSREVGNAVHRASTLALRGCLMWSSWRAF